MKNVIEIKDLKKKYDNFTLDIEELNIPSGVIIGLIGENGAGKTTLIKTLLKAINKDSGNIKIFGEDLDEKDVKDEIGVVLDNAFFPEILTSKDINSIMKEMYKNWDQDLFFKYINEFDIKPNQSLKTLSKGMRKKVEIASALSHHPKLLILDEATSGLDPIVRTEVLDLFLHFIEDEEHTIIMSSHITSDLDNIADYIVFINKGKIISELEKDEILSNYGILKCTSEEFEKLDKEDIVRYRKNRYNYEVLISDISKCKKKYKNYVIDKTTIENYMLFIIKGEK